MASMTLQILFSSVSLYPSLESFVIDTTTISANINKSSDFSQPDNSLFLPKGFVTYRSSDGTFSHNMSIIASKEYPIFNLIYISNNSKIIYTI